MSGTEKVLIIGAITALAVVLALARRPEPPGPGAVGKANPQQQGQGDIVEFPPRVEQKEKALA